MIFDPARVARKRSGNGLIARMAHATSVPSIAASRKNAIYLTSVEGRKPQVSLILTKVLYMAQTNDSIPLLLSKYRTIAVVGLSPKSSRPSHEVAEYMQAHGYRIIPVNPNHVGTHILGEYCYATLAAAAAALAQDNVKIEIVDCFRKSEAIAPIADEAIAIGAKVLWMQLGVVNREAEAAARAAGLDVVMDHCIKIEHMRAGA